MLNSCEFIGNLGADPEVKSFANGGRVCNLRLAVTDKWKNSAGERQERTEWISVSIFSDGLVGVAERYLRKGSKLFVRGQFRTRKYTAQDGSDRYSTEIVLQGPDAVLTMLDGPPSGQGGQPDTGGASSRGRGGSDWGQGSAKGGFADDLDDDVPFATNDSIW